jgi:hypothetical protein
MTPQKKYCDITGLEVTRHGMNERNAYFVGIHATRTPLLRCYTLVMIFMLEINRGCCVGQVHGSQDTVALSLDGGVPVNQEPTHWGCPAVSRSTQRGSRPQVAKQ